MQNFNAWLKNTPIGFYWIEYAWKEAPRLTTCSFAYTARKQFVKSNLGLLDIGHTKKTQIFCIVTVFIHLQNI